MPLGLVPFIGSGTGIDPFRPSDWDGTGYLDLRPPGQTAGFCLVEQPSLTPLQRIADALDEVLGPTARTRLTTLGYIPPTGATVREAIADLFLAPPLTLPIRPLLPTVQGMREIWLRGVRIFSLPVVAGGTTLTESFNKADAITLGPDQTWTEFAGEDQWEVFSNQARLPTTAGSDNSARVDADLASADHYCQASITTLVGTTSDRYVGLITRKDATATLTYYLALRISTAGQTNNWSLYKRVAAGFTSLSTLTETEPAVPYTLKGESNGSIQRLLVGGVEKLNVTDTAITGNLRCGIHGFRNAGGIISLDAWEAADLAAAVDEMKVHQAIYRGVERA